MPTQSDPNLNEDRILIACALRFDGYYYREAYPFDEEGITRNFFATGVWEASLPQQMTLFFLMQRWLYKWGGEYESNVGRYWRAFRELFLNVYRHDIPDGCRTQDEYLDMWDTQYRPHLDAVEAYMRTLHTNLPYDDDTPLMTRLDNDTYNRIERMAQRAAEEVLQQRR